VWRLKRCASCVVRERQRGRINKSAQPAGGTSPQLPPMLSSIPLARTRSADCPLSLEPASVCIDGTKSYKTTSCNALMFRRLRFTSVARSCYGRRTTTPVSEATSQQWAHDTRDLAIGLSGYLYRQDPSFITSCQDNRLSLTMVSQCTAHFLRSPERRI